MEVEIDERWVNVYDWMHLDEAQKETKNKQLDYYISFIAKMRAKMEKAAARRDTGTPSPSPAAHPVSAVIPSEVEGISVLSIQPRDPSTTARSGPSLGMTTKDQG
jgi:hypothetical protein